MDKRELQANLFVAVPLPEAVKQVIAETTSRVGGQLSFRKWVHPADYHITVKFLGRQNPGLAGNLRTVLEPVAQGHERFTLQLAEAGTFGKREAPRILWIGIDGERGALAALQANTEKALAGLGFEPEGRPYSPHITIARTWTGEGPLTAEHMQALSAGLVHGDGPQQWEVEELVLYRTHMGHTPMYEKIARYPLG